MISGSSIERVALCPGSEALPHVDDRTAASERGTAVHTFLAECLTLGREAALERVPTEYLDVCEAIETEKLPACDPGAFAAEVAFVLDLATGEAREIGRMIERGYGELGPYEIPMTADVVGLTADGEAVVILDYKGAWSRAAKASGNWQLRALAIAATRAYGRSRAIVGIIRVGPDTTRKDIAEHDALDLDIAFGELVEIHDRATKLQGETDPAKLELAMGEHCKYCPAFHACPAKMNLVRRLAEEPASIEVELTEGFRSIDDAARYRAWILIKAMTSLLDRVEPVMRESIGRKPIDIGNGTVLALVPQEVREFSMAETFAEVEKLSSAAAASLYDELTISSAAIERSIKGECKARGLKVAPTLRGIKERVEAEGGVTTTTRRVVKEIALMKLQEIAS